MDNANEYENKNKNLNDEHRKKPTICKFYRNGKRKHGLKGKTVIPAPIHL